MDKGSPKKVYQKSCRFSIRTLYENKGILRIIIQKIQILEETYHNSRRSIAKVGQKYEKELAEEAITK